MAVLLERYLPKPRRGTRKEAFPSLIARARQENRRPGLARPVPLDKSN
jgi:hypothetical protein